MSVTHVLYVPVVFLIGLAIGYVAGAKAARAEQARARDRAKE